jgi:hypothetical protein
LLAARLITWPFVSRYLVALPSPKQLQEFIERDRERIEVQIQRGRRWSAQATSNASQ